MIQLFDNRGHCLVDMSDPEEAIALADGDSNIVKIVDSADRYVFVPQIDGWTYVDTCRSASYCRRCQQPLHTLGDGWTACQTCDSRPPTSYPEARRGKIKRIFY